MGACISRVSKVGIGGIADLPVEETERPLVDGGDGYCDVGEVVRTGITVCGGVSEGAERSGSARRPDGGIAMVSFLTGDPSRIAVSLDALEEAGALLPLRGFLARSLVGCVRK